MRFLPKTALLNLMIFTGMGSTSPLPVPAKPPVKTVTVNLQEEFQTIHSFGASDCWSAKFIGKWRDEAKKNQIADLLFGLDTLPSGQPKGIGLSLWRVNIGAGSYEQGDSSRIGNEWRREESFLNAKGRYDWTKQSGSQWFLQAAWTAGKNGKAGQEGSPAENADIAAVTKALSAKLVAKKAKTMVVTGEAGQLNFLYEKAESGRGNQRWTSKKNIRIVTLRGLVS